MQTEEIKLKKVVADAGHVFVDCENNMLGTTLFLSQIDDIGNYREITVEEAEQIKTAREMQEY